MMNTTKNTIVFHQDGFDLQIAILGALKTASNWTLKAYGFKNLDPSSVTTRANSEAAFPAYVESSVLDIPLETFGEQYILDAFKFCSQGRGELGKELYEKLTNAPREGRRAFKKAFRQPLRRGFGAFLVRLHCHGVITLPCSFRWPIGLESDSDGKFQGRREICDVTELPELVAFFRALQSQASIQSDPVFASLNVKQRERLAWAGGKVIMALGWLNLEDANYAEMVEFKSENEKSNFTGQDDPPFLMLCEVLSKKFGDRIAINSEGWQSFLRQESREKNTGKLNHKECADSSYLLEQAFSLSPAEMWPERMEGWYGLPGISFDMEKSKRIWVALQKAFFRKIRRESDKSRRNAIGYLNIYLFGYLPYWFAVNPSFQFDYPDCPNKLISAVFVADLGMYQADVKPLPFVEFLNRLAMKRQWAASTHYATLKQIEKFFDFVVRVGDQTVGCENFKQPIASIDYPRQPRQQSTKKRPIPRRIFKVYIQYIECLCTYLEVLLARIVDEQIHDPKLVEGLGHTTTIIDTFETAGTVGYIPILFHGRKCIPLRYIPNVLCLGYKRLSGGVTCRVPHPHALYQILVSLFTGIRQQHIQWLDEATFDQEVYDDGNIKDYAELIVNTDKVKTVPWKSSVNFQVIDILRKQRAWRKLIDEPGFCERVPYNGNSESKWGTILPLFSYETDGSPHSDAIYTSAWKRILAGVQGILPEIGESNLQLIHLLPKCVSYDDDNIIQKLYDYGLEQTRKCELSLKSAITPHSARVSVVSHSISILPADIIGKYWTGQTAATVCHYVVLDEDEVFAEQQLQNMRLRSIGYEQGYHAMLKAAPGQTSPYVIADADGSNLSSSLNVDLEETLVSYGCISLSLDGEEKTGMDVLRETRAVGAVINKTEICPFGNICPKEVVLKLGGLRRCGPCNYAVRSIDHLPAVTAAGRQVFERLNDLNKLLDDSTGNLNLTPDELDDAEFRRGRLAEDLAAWQMSGEVLEMMRQRIARGESDKTWHIQRPEIIAKHLQRVQFPSSTSQYVLARLAESEAFPMLESPQIRSRFELLRRRLLANVGRFQDAFSTEPALNPAAECLGLIRTVVNAHNISIDDIEIMLDGDGYLESLPSAHPQLLNIDTIG